MKKGKRFVAIDVRTPAESEIYSKPLPGCLKIPLNELFKVASLELQLKDYPMMVVCKSGAFATVAGVASRHIGFSDV